MVADSAAPMVPIDPSVAHLFGPPDLMCEVETLRLDSVEAITGNAVKIHSWTPRDHGEPRSSPEALGAWHHTPANAHGPGVGREVSAHGYAAATQHPQPQQNVSTQRARSQEPALPPGASIFHGLSKLGIQSSPPTSRHASPRPTGSQRPRPSRGPSLLAKRYHDATAGEQQQELAAQQPSQAGSLTRESPPPSGFMPRAPPRRMLSAPHLLHHRHQQQHHSSSTPASPTAAGVQQQHPFSFTAGLQGPGAAAAAAAAQQQAARPPRKVVVVWDLDETLIVFNSLINGAFVRANSSVDSGEAAALGERWRDAILSFCDSHLHYKQLEELEFSHISQIPSLTDVTPAEQPATAGAEPQVSKRVRLASPPPGLPSLSTEQQAQVEECYAAVMATYAAGVRRLPVARARAQDLEMLYTETDQLSGGWLSASRRLLAELLQQEQRVEHVLVTNGQLVATLGKLLLFRLDDLFPAHNVYSSSAASKHYCFKMIHKRFGDDCRYVAIGDGPDESAAADFMRWPFVRILLDTHAGQKPAGAAGAAGAAKAAPAAAAAAGGGISRSGASVLGLSGEQLVALATAPLAGGRAQSHVEASLHHRLARLQRH